MTDDQSRGPGRTDPPENEAPGRTWLRVSRWPRRAGRPRREKPPLWAARIEMGPWEQKEAILARIAELEAILTVVQRRAVGDAERVQEVETYATKAWAELDEARKALGHTTHPAMRRASHLGVAESHLDAALNLLVWLAPAEDLKALLPHLLALVEEHFAAVDPRRTEVTEVVRQVQESGDIDLRQRALLAETVSLARRLLRKETLRVRSFVRIVKVVTAGLFVTAALVSLIAFNWPRMVPLCFAPEVDGDFRVVCPTGSASFENRQPDTRDIANIAQAQDYLAVGLVGVVSAAIASASALRRIRGTSLPYNVPVVLALLKLPTGALTAVLGLLLMRGGFVPGLSALDSSAQIIAWAIIFGYSQQLFTKFVDNQGQAVLDAVRGPSTLTPSSGDVGKL